MYPFLLWAILSWKRNLVPRCSSDADGEILHDDDGYGQNLALQLRWSNHGFPQRFDQFRNWTTQYRDSNRMGENSYQVWDEELLSVGSHSSKYQLGSHQAIWEKVSRVRRCAWWLYKANFHFKRESLRYLLKLYLIKKWSGFALWWQVLFLADVQDNWAALKY